MDRDSGVGIGCESRSGQGRGEQWGKIGTTVMENNKKYLNFRYLKDTVWKMQRQTQTGRKCLQKYISAKDLYPE